MRAAAEAMGTATTSETDTEGRTMDTVTTPKHTAGPWKVEHIPGLDMGATAEITALCGDGGTPFDGRSIIVAQAWKTDDEIPRWSDDETAQANARLMAAAPELLAALRGMRDHDAHECGNNTRPGETCPHYAAMLAAIAKAEGVTL